MSDAIGDVCKIDSSSQPLVKAWREVRAVDTYLDSDSITCDPGLRAATAKKFDDAYEDFAKALAARVLAVQK